MTAYTQRIENINILIHYMQKDKTELEKMSIIDLLGKCQEYDVLPEDAATFKLLDTATKMHLLRSTLQRSIQVRTYAAKCERAEMHLRLSGQDA